MKKMMKKLVAATLSATMVLGMSLTAFASQPTINIPVVGAEDNASVATLTVPSSYAMALNPAQMEVLPVSGGGVVAVSSQIVSRNFAFLNKTPNKDVVVTLELNVTAPKECMFVDSVSGYTKEDEYALVLQAVPAAVSGSTVQVVSGAGTTNVTINSTQPELSKAIINAVSSEAVTLDNGASNMLEFMLDKATGGGKYELKDDGTVVKTQSVTSEMGSKGVAGFTFQGELNTNADWTKVTAAGGIKIVPIYTPEIVNDAETVVGTTNMVASKFSAGTDPYTITFTENGTKKTDVKLPTGVHVQYQGKLVDITTKVKLESGKITITDTDTKNLLKAEGTTARVKVVYTTQSGKTKIATVKDVITN